MIHEVATLLPYHLDDTEQVNDTFARWRQGTEERDKRLIDVWTYCYIYRYFLLKFATSEVHPSLAFDRLVATAFADVQANLHGVRQPACYAGWVSTICRNTFVSHLRARRRVVSLDQAVSIAEPVASSARDAAVLQRSIGEAIETLPGFLRDVARMRLLEHRSYTAIQQATGKALPTLRTYVNRALVQLRRNTKLRTLLEELRYN